MARGRLQPIATALTDPDIADALNDLDALIGEVADHKNCHAAGRHPFRGTAFGGEPTADSPWGSALLRGLRLTRRVVMPQWGCGVGRTVARHAQLGRSLRVGATERPARDAMQSVRSIPRRLGRPSSRRQFDS